MQGEHQEHLRRPPTDTPQLGQFTCDVVVVLVHRQGSQIEVTRVCGLGEATDGAGLRAGEPDGTHGFVIDVEHSIRGDRSTEVGMEAFGDGVSCPHRELLADDRDYESMERITLGFAPDGAQR